MSKTNGPQEMLSVQENYQTFRLSPAACEQPGCGFLWPFCYNNNNPSVCLSVRDKSDKLQVCKN